MPLIKYSLDDIVVDSHVDLPKYAIIKDKSGNVVSYSQIYFLEDVDPPSDKD